MFFDFLKMSYETDLSSLKYFQIEDVDVFSDYKNDSQSQTLQLHKEYEQRNWITL